MHNLRKRLGIGANDDSGFSLIEVVVAMLIFAVVSAGVVYAMLSVMRVTKDSRDRQVAANLAAQEIDLARDIDDLFLLLDDDRTVDLNGDTFRIVRTTSWFSNQQVELPCGAGGGTLRYKEVDVTVTWDNMRPGVDPVKANTVIDPHNRINDPALGTILVSVIGASGTGVAGATVTAVPASPANGAQALTSSPAATDAQGCSYILRVKPGNYVVSVSKANYVSDKQAATGVAPTVQVTAGASVSAAFAYDLGANLNLSYYSNPVPTTPKIPITLDTSFVNSAGTYVTPTTAATFSRALRVFPYASGYNIFAGYYREPSEASAGCVSVDPGQWIAGVRSGQNVAGVRPDTVPAAPGTTLATTVPMGQVRISSTSNLYLKAVSSATFGPGDPGCAIGMTYKFTQQTSGSTTTLTLPYGSWEIFSGTTSGTQNTIVAGTRMTLITTGTVTGAVVTLDPRVVVP
jgi:prepilin-type N-terminal cleavage/methylation domain-containing protein